MPQNPDFALSHIRFLTDTIGGRGSCTANEKAAADYVSRILTELNVSTVSQEPFLAIPSTYRPFAMGFVFTLVGSIVVIFGASRLALFIGAFLNLLGTWAMLAETEFASHWARWILPKRQSQNVTGYIPAQGKTKAKVVLSAHLDTHRTPIFYSSPTWHSLFTMLLALTFIIMVAGTIIFGLGAILDWSAIRWLAVFTIPIQVLALSITLHADFTPYSPGANDDASGVGVILDTIRRLSSEPLKNTQVHLAITGCEEVGSYGIQSYLDLHSDELGDQAFYIIMDEVGIGKIKYLSADGLLLKHKTHPRALAIAREISALHPEIGAVERVGKAYTDALRATKRGLASLTVCTEIDAATGDVSHWHQMSDTVETLQVATLSHASAFLWEILQHIDRTANV